MNSLEQKRRELDLKRVQMAMFELQFKIDERLEEIERLKENLKISAAKEAEIKQELGRE